jgi:hypothetical protein
MRGKYITTLVLMACRSKRTDTYKDIHTQLEETIAERRIVLALWEKTFLGIPAEAKKDIHALLQETIAERKKILEQWESIFFVDDEDDSYYMQEKEAA